MVMRLRRAIESTARLDPWTLFFGFVAILFLRHPQALLRADFWGEDGAVWYAQAYEISWRCLLVPHTGYLQTTSRLVALLAQNFPLRWAPTIFAACALVIQALPPTLLMSKRMQDAWPDPVSRLAFALIYVGLPSSVEVLTNLTNAQWHLACLAFLNVTIRPSLRWPVRAAELLALALSGLSGPFAIFLLPIAVWQCLDYRNDRAVRWVAVARVIVVAMCVAIQGSFLLGTMAATRPGVPLGAGAITLARMIGIRIMIRMTRLRIWSSDALPLAIVAVGGGLAGIALQRGNALLRKGFVWAALLFPPALATPVVSLAEPQ
jgi:hypothetical protein